MALPPYFTSSDGFYGRAIGILLVLQMERDLSCKKRKLNTVQGETVWLVQNYVNFWIF